MLRDPEELRAWLDKADGDLRMARLAMGAESPLWDQACFPVSIRSRPLRRR
jgi:hypothetical protein